VYVDFKKGAKMIKNRTLIVIVLLFVIGIFTCKKSEAPKEKTQVKLVVENIVTLPEIDSISGLKGIRLVPMDSLPGAKGELNFAIDDSTLILVVDYISPEEFNGYKEQSEYIQAAVPGIGDEAFSAPAGAMQYILLFRKGDHSFLLSSFLNPDSEWSAPFLNMEQLEKVAKTIISRIPSSG
jgi:hypothetical protein